MKILAFTDVHANKRMLLKLVHKARDADIMLCCGDLSLFGDGLRQALKLLTRAGKPLLLIHGNHEEETVIEHLSMKHVIPFHRKSYRMGNYLFLGHGGGGFSLTDHKLEKRLHQLKEKIREGDKIIFVTHAPPYGTELDLLPLFGHVGCRTITKAIKELKPHLFLCGHLHENFNVHQKLDRTLMINPGPLGKIIEL